MKEKLVQTVCFFFVLLMPCAGFAQIEDVPDESYFEEDDPFLEELFAEPFDEEAPQKVEVLGPDGWTTGLAVNNSLCAETSDPTRGGDQCNSRQRRCVMKRPRRPGRVYRCAYVEFNNQEPPACTCVSVRQKRF